MWRNAWNRKLAYQTPTAAEPTEREKLCTDLCAIGVDARWVEPGQLQEVIDADWGAQPFSEIPTSLGLIEVRHSPIRLVNVLTKSVYQGQNYGYEDFYKNVYLVPDSTIFPDSTMFWEGYEMPVHGYGRSVRVKNVPLFGRVVGLRWKGEFDGDIITGLGQDVLLNLTLIRLKEDIEIHSYPEYGCWTISTPSNQDEPTAPSREKWDCYERIARHLLETSVK